MDDVRFAQTTYGPAALGIIPAACLVVLIWAVWRTRQQASLSTRAWLAPSFVALTAACVWYALGIGSPDVLALTLFGGFILGCSALVLSRGEVWDVLPPTSRTRRVFAAIAVTGTCALEFTCNDTFFMMCFPSREMALPLSCWSDASS